MQHLGLYIHIPFCRKKCSYCDFVSYAGKEELIDRYVQALTREIKGLGDWGTGGLKTIYFGGGTPTLFEPKHFEAILKNVAATFRLPYNGGLKTAATFETTTEANPGTADRSKLKELRTLGINRLSIGAQSFSDKLLKTLGRIHDSKDIFRSYEDARSAGFENINLDLIFALPGQTPDEWKKDLKIAIDLEPNHLSTYNLQIEEGTLLWDMTHLPPPTSKPISFPQFQLPSEEEELEMYEHTIDALTENGFKHYEISNFARPGFECRHNINYWKNGNYIGIGAGAHSHVNGKRWANPDPIEAYLSTMGEGQETRNDTGIAADQRETIFMGLRLLEGLPADKFQGFEKEVDESVASGLLTRKDSRIKLTRKGLYLANLVFEKFV